MKKNTATQSRKPRRGFTLIELLIVLGIIAILVGVMLGTMSGSSESAKAARCLGNMRTLAQACMAAAAADTTWHRYPAAGSHEYMDVDESNRTRPTVYYGEHKGWISWNSQGVYQGKKAKTHQASASWMTSMFSENRDENLYCLTNGAIWKYVGGNAGTYVCPSHATAKSRRGKSKPVWSYLMNSQFGWDYSQGSKALGDVRKVFGDLNRADKMLLFSEVPFSGIGAWQPDGTGAGTDCDCVLQFNGSLVQQTSSMLKGQECIGVNHKNGRNLYAHVAFADGHVEKLSIPYSGNIKAPQIDDGELRNLTAWLCVGKDVSFDGKRYQKMDN